MRMAMCYQCHTLSKLDDYKGSNPDNDSVLQDWIQRHLHGFHPDDTGGDVRDGGQGRHPGGRVFVVDVKQAGLDKFVRTRINPRTGRTEQISEPMELDKLEMQAVEEIRKDLLKVNQEVYDYRDELREDAVKCHQRHNQPEAPGRPCIDYRAPSKLLGRSGGPQSERQALCTYCPYTSSITVEVRHRRGMYRRS